MSLFPSSQKKFSTDELPLLTLRELVLFPHTMVPVFVSQKASVQALDAALKRDSRVFCVCRKQDAAETDYYDSGSVARIVQQLRLPDGTIRVLLEGEYRARIGEQSVHGGVPLVKVVPLGQAMDAEADAELLASIRAIQHAFSQYAELSRKVSPDALAAAERCDNYERLANLVCNALAIKTERKLELLVIEQPRQRLAAVLETLEMENEIISLQRKISGKVKTRMDRSQREYILNEQLKEINKELGKDGVEDEFRDLEKQIADRKPPAEVQAKAARELARLRKLQPLSPEAGVLRTYLEWIADLPWSETTDDSHDLALAERVLDEDHFDMRKAKERIVEFIAVRHLTQAIKGPILCFVGPPGTGKTSLGRSVARALGRRFVRISLGGVRDEAEIRGHRKTYVGALPGKILQSMKKAGSVNPVFLLDEIDKLSNDFRGDPASALLEVLDPEQNNSFTDHYLEVPYDLSKVLFIATANSLHGIPYPLLDRMEIIEVPGYGEREKLSIAKQFLIPKSLRDNGLATASVRFTDAAILEIIRYWTMESGVRSLERSISRCARRLAREAVLAGFGPEPTVDAPASEAAATAAKRIPDFKKRIQPRDIERLLGRKLHKSDVLFREPRIGVAYGLAWTESGGTLLPVETVRFPGSGELILTGNLGDVMKESARAALSYLRSAGPRLGLEAKDIAKSDFHIHVPEGAIPKDGPSAGITLASALLSALRRVAPKAGIAMTGELTLTGRVLPIGGLKEKLLAAIRNGMTTAIVPSDNQDEVRELDAEIKASIQIMTVEYADEAFGILFGQPDQSAPETASP